MKIFIFRFFTNFILILFIILSISIIFNSLTKIFFENKENYLFINSLIAIIGLIFLIFLVICLQKKNETKINISIFLLSITFTIYSVETFLHFKNKDLNPREIRTKQLQKPYDKRDKINVIEDLRNEGIDAYLKYVPILLSESNGIRSESGNVFPLAGISKSTTVLLNESGFYPVIETDEHGFNNPKGLYTDNIDILIIGDSYAEGDGVNSKDNIAASLRNDDLKVISLGQNGNGPLIEYASLREYGKYLKPKIVLWLYFVNDLGDLKIELNSSILKNYLSNENFTQNLINRQAELDLIIKNYLNTKTVSRKKEIENLNNKIPNEIIKLKNIQSLLNIIPEIYIESRGDVPKKEFEKILSNSKKLTENWGGKMYLVYLPSYFAFASKNENRFHSYILKTASENNIPTIDMYNVFLKNPNPLDLFSLQMNSHYNPRGYNLVAEKILERLEKEK